MQQESSRAVRGYEYEYSTRLCRTTTRVSHHHADGCCYSPVHLRVRVVRSLPAPDATVACILISVPIGPTRCACTPNFSIMCGVQRLQQ